MAQLIWKTGCTLIVLQTY